MRLRVIDRILIALSGLIMLVLAALSVLNLLGVTVTPLNEAQAYLTEKNLWAVAVAIACVILVLLGIYEVSVLFRRGRNKRGFIAQKSENGEIAISVKTIESLVTKCAKKHGEIAVQSVHVEETRGGLLIKLRATMPSGMNIPLAVGTLQKQVKQYITACSGVDVSEVRVKVESTDQAASGSPYAVADDASALPVDQPEPAPVPEEAVTPVEVPVEAPVEPAEEQELPTHQRLFAAAEEPALVPAPPTSDEPAIPTEEEIEAEVEAAIAAEDIEGQVEAAIAAEEIQPETEATKPLEAEEDPDIAFGGEWTAEDEAHWTQIAAQMEEQAAAWDAISAEAEKLEAEWDAASQAAPEGAEESGETDGEEKTTEE